MTCLFYCPECNYVECQFSDDIIESLHKQRAAVERSRAELEDSAAREAALKEDLVRVNGVCVTRARSKSRSAVKELKRSVELLILDHDRALEGFWNDSGECCTSISWFYLCFSPVLLSISGP